MLQFVLSLNAIKQLNKLPKNDQVRIKQKLLFWEQQKNPLDFAKPLVNFRFATHRFRVGDYRIICRTEQKELIIVVIKISHRNDVYKR